MPVTAENQVSEWLNDALAIVARRPQGVRLPEINLRRGLEAIVRHLATSAPPVPDVADVPDDSRRELSASDLRNVRQALDACLTVFGRHDHCLNTAQRRIQILVRACRRNADEALQSGEPSAPLPVRVARR